MFSLVACFLCWCSAVSDFCVEFHRRQIDCRQNNYGNNKGKDNSGDCSNDWGNEYDKRGSNDPGEDIDTKYDKKQ